MWAASAWMFGVKGFPVGWLSKLWSLFGYAKYQVPYYNRGPQRDHNFDSYPVEACRLDAGGFRVLGFKGLGFRVCLGIRPAGAQRKRRG